MRLEGVAIYATGDVLQIAREEEMKSTTKRPREGPQKVPIVEISSEEEDGESDSSDSSSVSAYSLPETRRRYATRSRGEE